MKFSAVAGPILSIGTGADGATGRVGDTRIRLLNDGGVVLASDDDSGPVLYSLIMFAATSTGTQSVGFAAYTVPSTGDCKGFLDCTVPQRPPPNDVCAGAMGMDVVCGISGVAGDSLDVVSSNAAAAHAA